MSQLKKFKLLFKKENSNTLLNFHSLFRNSNFNLDVGLDKLCVINLR